MRGHLTSTISSTARRQVPRRLAMPNRHISSIQPLRTERIRLVTAMALASTAGLARRGLFMVSLQITAAR